MTTSGLPASSIRGRTPVRALPATNLAFSIPLRSALRSASSIASGTISRPQISPASRGHRQADRADAAEEVEDALAPGQSGELRRDPVEALGHLGVGLEERAVGHLELEAAELLVQAFFAERPGRAVGAARVALDRRVEVDRRAGQARRGGHQAGLDLPGPPSLADDEVAEHAASRRRVVGREVLHPRPFAHPVAGRVAGFRGQLAVVDVDDQVPAAARVEAERDALVGESTAPAPKEYSSLLR